MIKLTINGQKVQAKEGDTILQAAKASGIHIPTLCYLENYAPLGACRVCLVEVQGAKALVASCAAPVARAGQKPAM